MLERLVKVRVVRARDDHLGAGVDVILVRLLHCLWVVPQDRRRPELVVETAAEVCLHVRREAAVNDEQLLCPQDVKLGRRALVSAIVLGHGILDNFLERLALHKSII